MSLTRRELMFSSLAAASAPSLVAQRKRPNILFAIADDWGWPHAGAYGCTWVNTPSFDRVAKEGRSIRELLHVEPQVRSLPREHTDRAQ